MCYLYIREFASIYLKSDTNINCIKVDDIFSQKKNDDDEKK